MFSARNSILCFRAANGDDPFVKNFCLTKKYGNRLSEAGGSNPR